ncbi:vacuolar sorting protein VPS33/slp1 [Clydaea vesicula]|uniref:Vacuolar sorting protein VPS33/slp1 n=1 Tax=Clydaea vesicula TaxID=447962 RepID=A0AAD5U940_9FUNG|nr:vacuolar sorting protein VPS33/slp1 [Clydaea vesicula]
MYSSLKACVKSRLLDDMIKINTGSYKILIIDEISLKLLNSVLTMSEIQDHQFALVETLSKRRKAYLDYDAIYFIEPTIHNIQLVIDDFQALERLIFSLERPSTTYLLYNPPTPLSLKTELNLIAKKLSFVFGVLNEFPLIKFYNPPTIRNIQNNFCNTVGFALLEELKELKKLTIQFGDNKPDNEKATVIIMDRGIDVAATFLHEFTYQSVFEKVCVGHTFQAMLADLVGFEENSKIRWDGEGSVNGFVTLDEKDPVWSEIRHKHIADAMDYLAENVQKFTTGNKAAQFAQQNLKNSNNSLAQISQLQTALSALPEFQEQKARFSLHTDLCKKCMDEYNSRKLENVSRVEQELVTGETNEGKSSRLSVNSLYSLFDDPKIEKEEKLRLALLYLISKNGMTEDERERLLQHKNLLLNDSEKQAITNLSLLGVKLSVSYDKSRDYVNPFFHLNRKSGVRDKKFDNCRFIPSLKAIAQDQIKGTLDEKLFPYIEKPVSVASTNGNVLQSPALRNTKASWATKRQPSVGSNSSGSTLSSVKELKVTGPRIILFVLGGISYSEIRSAYEIMEETNREVIIGSTSINSPYEFINLAKFLHRPSPPTTQMILQSEKQLAPFHPPPSVSQKHQRGDSRLQDVNSLGRRDQSSSQVSDRGRMGSSEFRNENRSRSKSKNRNQLQNFRAPPRSDPANAPRQGKSPPRQQVENRHQYDGRQLYENRVQGEPRQQRYQNAEVDNNYYAERSSSNDPRFESPRTSPYNSRSNSGNNLNVNSAIDYRSKSSPHLNEDYRKVDRFVQPLDQRLQGMDLHRGASSNSTSGDSVKEKEKKSRWWKKG